MFFWGRTQSTAKNEVCVLLWYRILAEKAKSFCGVFFFFFLGLGGIEIGERDGEILGFCFSGRNSIRALSIVLSRRERGEREKYNKRNFFFFLGREREK